MLHSIQKIKKVYNTGDKPVLVECNDLNNYVCKHNGGQSKAYKLFAEWICHCLLEELSVALPTKEIIQIKDEHVLGDSACQLIFFKDKPCFGTLHLEEALEWNQFNSNAEIKSITNKNDLLKISFCDLWLGNEDRNWNNFNLLFNPLERGYEINPIDHAACFNSLSFINERKLVMLSQDETIIHTEEFRAIVKPLLKNMKQASEFIESLYICIPEIEKNYDKHVLKVPSEWNIPPEYINALKLNLFEKEWLTETKTAFLTFIKISLKLK